MPGLIMTGYAGRLTAQPASLGALPAAWQALGIVQWPLPHSLLRLKFDEIVLPGEVQILGNSSLRFTQSLWLFKWFLQAPAAMEQVATKTLQPGDSAELRVMFQATRTQTLTLLAKTPAGWFRADRELKVGRAAK